MTIGLTSYPTALTVTIILGSGSTVTAIPFLISRALILTATVNIGLNPTDNLPVYVYVKQALFLLLTRLLYNFLFLLSRSEVV